MGKLILKAKIRLRNAIRGLEKHKDRARESRKVENEAQQAQALDTVIFLMDICAVWFNRGS